MSKASAVRDDIITELSDRFPDNAVEAFVVPSYAREELADGARIMVRTGGRELTLNQGPDDQNVVIEIGVVGITPERTGTGADYRTQELAQCDSYDELMEDIIALWMHGGALERCGFAYHSLVDIEQSIQVDPKKLYEDGIWFSLISLTFRDIRDEIDE